MLARSGSRRHWGVWWDVARAAAAITSVLCCCCARSGAAGSVGLRVQGSSFVPLLLPLLQPLLLHCAPCCCAVRMLRGASSLSLSCACSDGLCCCSGSATPCLPAVCRGGALLEPSSAVGMQKQRSEETAAPRLALALALPRLPVPAGPSTAGGGAETLAVTADASPGGASSVTEVDPIDVSDGDFFETFHVVAAPLAERREEAVAEVVVSDDDGTEAAMPALLHRADAMHAAPDGGLAPPESLLALALAGSGVVDPPAGSAVAPAEVRGMSAVRVRSSASSGVLREEAAASAATALSHPEPPTKLPRTRWGRCGIVACQGPLRLLVDNAQGRPFLGCSRWKASSPGSCTFSTGFPEDRRDELPLRMRTLRRVTW